ncbi:MAG: YcaO-like family protein [Desulfobacterales bacterium]|jgi:ribosomal protein S12 methylthiotransferase accessory factor|nr:YcaO-like family protein [Desulfobacterales bacterium]
MNNILILNDAIKGFTLDQDKIITPEETVRRLKTKLSQLNLDILDRAERIDNGRLDIPVYFSVCGKDALSIIGTKKQMGKGATLQQAEASAVMELAERFSFFSFCKQPNNFVTACYKAIRDKAISFDLIARSVHDDTGELDITRGFFETLPLQWTRAYNLTKQEEVLIPFTWFYAINEFNGPSAGNCREEALMQGISEVMERHVSSLISQNRLRVPSIRPESVTDPIVLDMFRKYRQAGIQLFLSDFSLDTGIPTVGVLAYDPATFPKSSEIVWTAGTTPDPQKALSRALTEVAQLAGDFNTAANYVASGLPKFSTLAEADYVMNPGKEVDIQDLPDISNPNIRIEIENCIAALADNGMEIIVIDTMHSELKVPAFYTIIPGAHFRERARGTSVGMFCAKIVHENAQPALALKTLREMDNKLPGKYFIQFYMGSCLLNLGDPRAALPYFKKALSLQPNEQDIPSIYSYIGVCLKEMGLYREAISVLQQGETFDQERTDIYNLMGFCHFMLKEHEAAILNFKKVLALNPSSAIDYANIASNYRDMGHTDNAIQYYELALELDAGIDFARINLEKLRGQKTFV